MTGRRGAKKPLLTDEEYLLHLFETWRSNHIDLRFAFMAERHPDWLDDIDPGFAEDFRSSTAFLRGQLTEALRESSLSLTEPEFSGLANIPVGFLPQEEFNACAVLTPTGGAVILLNTSLVDFLPSLCCCVLGVLSPHLLKEMSNRLTPGDCAVSVCAIAEELLDPGHDLIREVPFFGDPTIVAKLTSADVYDLISPAMGFVHAIERFILLHEYGHVALGHLNARATRPSRQDKSVQVYTNDQAQEFEADEFAFKAMIKGVESQNQAHILDALGVLFGLFQLLETVAGDGDAPSDHPSAAARWARLRSLADAGPYPVPTVSVFDQIVSMIAPGREPLEYPAGAVRG